MATRKNTDATTDEATTEAATEAVDDTATRSVLVEPAAEGLMSEADAPAQSADAPAPSAADEEDHTGKVPIKLANPIENPEHQRRLRLKEKPGGYNVHDIVWVTPDDARAIISAGLAQVDPEDSGSVLAAIRGQHDGMRA